MINETLQNAVFKHCNKFIYKMLQQPFESIAVFRFTMLEKYDWEYSVMLNPSSISYRNRPED